MIDKIKVALILMGPLTVIALGAALGVALTLISAVVGVISGVL